MKVSTFGLQLFNIFELRLGKISFDPPFSDSTQRHRFGTSPQESPQDVRAGTDTWRMKNVRGERLIRCSASTEPVDNTSFVTYDRWGRVGRREISPPGQLIDILG
jgi:hypothetical protein